MKNFDFIVYGNNSGAMVAAIELAKTKKVALVNPVPNWGAHFAGISVNGTNFDIGMNFFEFTTFHQASNDLLSYNAAIRNDSARFFKFVEKYIGERIDFVEVKTLETFTEGTFGGDISIANELDILQKLPSEIKNKIKLELQNIVDSGVGSLHASQKKINESLFLKSSFAEVSLANHGATFHDLFVEPICKKILNLSSHEVPALFHRIAWAPLFYPETLLDFLNGNYGMAPTLFHYPKAGNFAVLTQAWEKEIKTNSNITIFNQKPSSLKKTVGFELGFDGGDAIHASQLVWCVDLQTLLNLSAVPTDSYTMEKASVTLAFSVIHKSDIKRMFSTLYVCKDPCAIYRITNQEYSAGLDTETYRIVFEMNLDVLTKMGINSDAQILNHMNEFLIQQSILSKPLNLDSTVIKSFKNSVNLPSLNNLNNFEKLFNLTHNYLNGIELIGPAAGFVSTSFNDQIVQALKLAKKYS